jgi:hypothetical protein
MFRKRLLTELSSNGHNRKTGKMWMVIRTCMARMLCTDGNYRYDFEGVNNAVETKSEGEDENNRTVGTKCEAYGEDEAKNLSCNKIQSIATPPKPKRGKKRN